VTYGWHRCLICGFVGGQIGLKKLVDDGNLTAFIIRYRYRYRFAQSTQPVINSFSSRLVKSDPHLCYQRLLRHRRSQVLRCIFLLLKNLIYIRPPHSNDAYSRLVAKTLKEDKIHINLSNCRSPKEIKVDLSVDYAATHV
jgi:hypothetical protein